MNYLYQKAFLICFLFLAAPTLQAQCDSSALDIPYNGIDEDCDQIDGLRLQMPGYIYLAEGKDFEFFYRNVFLSKHPEDYTFSIVSPLLGEDRGDHWYLLPDGTMVGDHAFTFQIRNENGEIIESASSIVRIAAAETPASVQGKKVIIMGHSLVDQGVIAYYMAQHTTAPGNPLITFHGTRTSFLDNITKHEGLGGASWNYYLTNPDSPFNTTGSFDVRNYLDAVICDGCNPEYILIQLDVNDYCFTGFVSGKTFEETDDFIQADYFENILPFINEIRAQSPNTKIGICLTPPANNRPGIFLNHFGAGTLLADGFRWQKIVNTIQRKYTDFFAGRTTENIYLLPIHLGVDDQNHFDDVDPIHPYPSNGDETKPNGYRPIARAQYGWIKNMMADEAASCVLNATVKNVICDNSGTEDIPFDDTFTFDMKIDGENASNGCDIILGADILSANYGAFDAYGPLTTNEIQGAFISDKVNDACPILVPVSAADCSNGAIQYADLGLLATAVDNFPGPFTEFQVNFEVFNHSDIAAENVWVKIPKPDNLAFDGTTPFVATQGTYDFFFNFLWEVGDIAPNSGATITMNYFLGADPDLALYGEVYSSVQPDPDSAPNNGDYMQANEDDETLLILGSTSDNTPAIKQARLEISPNPILASELRYSFFNVDKSAISLEIYDMQGRLCTQQYSNATSLSVGHLAQGTYVLKVVLENGQVMTSRFLK